MVPWPSIPLCPTQALLHLDCPACGTTRGLVDLLQGDLVGALDHNLLLLVALPTVALAAANRWLGRPRLPALPRWALPAVVVLLAAFTVVRNLALPGLAWLDSA